MILRNAAALALWALGCAAVGQQSEDAAQDRIESKAQSASESTPQRVVEQAVAVLEGREGKDTDSDLQSAWCLGVMLPQQDTAEKTHPGLVSCRNGNEWSPPAMITVHGAQSGTSAQPLVFGITSALAVNRLLEGNYELSARSTGSIGGFSNAFHRRSSAFPGAADGLVISKDDAGNRLLYGESANFPSVLSGRVTAPAQETEFTRKLEQYVLLSETAGGGAGSGGGSSRVAARPESPSTKAGSSAPSSSAGRPGSANGATSGGTVLTKDYTETVAVTRRVTGIAFVPPAAPAALGGYGLYSYVLIDHRPSDEERARFRAFFVALLARPTAKSLVAAGVPLKRINITELLVNTMPEESRLEKLTAEEQSDWAIDHYDYGRSAAILACLPGSTGEGPVIVSLLEPVDVTKTPHPVLIQDLSHAQAPMMNSYVAEFVLQASRDQFWNQRALEQLSLQLRNLMEVAATGLGMSQEAVESWLKMVK